MPSRSLRSRPSLTQLKIQANELRALHRAGSHAAAARIVAHLPKSKDRTLQQALAEPLTLSGAQTIIAREYGFAGWSQLKQFVDIAGRVAACQPHPRFADAVAAFYAGDFAGLQTLLSAEPELARARGELEAPYGYFTGATLLHHTAGNPFRSPLPKNVVELAALLLERGADVEAETFGANGGTTMDLIITSKHATDAKVARPLMELLLKHGAKLDVHRPGALDAPLGNYATQAAEKMIELGAPVDICAAGALGRLELIRDCFDDHGALKSRPRRNGRLLSDRDAIGLAALFAYVNKHLPALDVLLEKDGNWNMIGVNNGTLLHRAAGEGNLAMVQRFVSIGADISNRNNPFNATPYSWADHAKCEHVTAWMRVHCPIDLHDAVSFNLETHARARIQEDPASVNRRVDQWSTPNATPLHMAARQKLDAMAKLLLEHGADPDAIAGNGQTALDMAEANGSEEMIALIRKHGGKRADAG